MIISHEYKFVFIQTRKTAGTSIKASLLPYIGVDDVFIGSKLDRLPYRNCPDGANGHISFETIGRIYGWSILKDYIVFCVERNSFDKVVSDWWFHTEILKRRRMSLKEFMLEMNRSDWDKYFYKGRMRARVLQYDNLSTEFEQLCADLSLPKIALHKYTFKKAEGRKPTRDYFDAATKSLAEEHFHRELSYFGYMLK